MLSRVAGRRPLQSSTMATSTSPERTWRRPTSPAACRSSRVRPGWARSRLASTGANAIAADGNALTTTRPDASWAWAETSASASSTRVRMRSA
jgi:hypothetical protein